MDRAVEATKLKQASNETSVLGKSQSSNSGMTASKKCVEVKPNFVINPYDAGRKPHSTKFELPKEPVLLDRFREEIMCKICKKILQTPFLIATCMHRLCKNCLPAKEAARKCPICDREVTRVSLDKNYELLINKLMKREKTFPRHSVLDVLGASGVDFHSFKKRAPNNDSPYPNDTNNHFCEPSTSCDLSRKVGEEPDVKRSRSGSVSSRLMIDEDDEDFRPPRLNSEPIENFVGNSIMVKPPSIQPPPILVSSPSKGPATFIVLPPKDSIYMGNQTHGTFSSNENSSSNSNSSDHRAKNNFMVQSNNSPKRPYGGTNASTSSNARLLTPIKPRFSPHDIIQVRTPKCWINFRTDQLNLLPVSIDSNSLVPLSSCSMDYSNVDVISLCDNAQPTFVSRLADQQPSYVEMTPELRKFLTQMPPQVLDLLPDCCREKPYMKPLLDEMTINARKQKLSKTAYAPLILWPDGSVYKEGLPNCTKHPRYIYTPMEATVAHLQEYILTRIEVEADWTERNHYAVEITNLAEEKDEVVILLSEETKNIANKPGLENAEFLSLKAQTTDGLFNTMIAIRQPFTALHPKLTVANLFHRYHANKRRPLKVVYRFVRKD